jgi:hypothetical protein
VSRTRSKLGVLLATLAATVGVAASAGTPNAQAATGIRFGLTDDAWLRTGPGELEDRLQELDDLGAQIVRFNIRWDTTARQRPTDARDPDDAAYTWSDDPILDGLREHGIAVVLGLVGTPRWANGGRAPNVAPTSAKSFGDFAAAAAAHYPWVTRWLVWNEPNQAKWLRPTSPSVYVARLLNPAYAAIHARIPRAQVGGGVTAPRGATGGVSPVAWLRGMRASHAKLDAYAHNPYPLTPTRETPLRGGCGHCTTISMADLGRLVTEVSRNFGRARIWLSEYGYQTNPPDRFLGVSPALQARYVGESSYKAYVTPRVDMLIHFLYRDEPTLARFQSGLVRLDDTPKPAYAAFQLPLAEVSRAGSRVRLWGEVRAPQGGSTYRLERLAGGTWRPIAAAARAGGRGFFRKTVSLPRGTLIRVVAGPLASPPLLVT